MENIYLIFLLPVVIYEEKITFYGFKQAVLLFIISFFQLLFMRLRYLLNQRFTEIFIFYRTVGYWEEIKREDVPLSFLKEGMNDFASCSNLKLVKTQSYCMYCGSYYRKLYDNFGKSIYPVSKTIDILYHVY